MTPVPRQGWFFLIEFLKWYFSKYWQVQTRRVFAQTVTYSNTNVFMLSVIYTFNTFRISALIYHIGIYLRILIIGKSHNPKMACGFYLYSIKKLLVVLVSCVTMGITIMS